VFHYRGSWGAAGSWSWSNVLEDAKAAVQALRATEIRSLSVVGHSLGGFTALHTAAADPSIDKVAAITAFDLGVEISDQQRYVEAFDAQLLPLSGTSGAALVDEMVANGPDWRLADLAPKLADRPVLLIGGRRDEDAPYEQHHLPLVDAYRQGQLEHHLFDTDHSLSDHREKLGRTVLAFLQS
jgi:pimeloyl-ACP methyl ester carboxylesterase